MALSWNAQSDGDQGMVADRNLYLDKSRDVLVEENDSRCASLLCGKGRAIYADEVQRLGLVVVDGRVVQPTNEPEAVAEVEVQRTNVLDGPENPNATWESDSEHGAAEG